jgi:hypothetical protein
LEQKGVEMSDFHQLGAGSALTESDLVLVEALSELIAMSDFACSLVFSSRDVDSGKDFG